MSRRLALLISNNQYSDANLAKLAAPLADAEALARVLRDLAVGAFDEVQTLVNQPSAEIRHAIAGFFHGKQPTDLLLLYFSGHGLIDERSRLYLATPDTDAKLPRARSVEAAYLAQEMEDSRSKRQVLILDCCHSGAFRQGITKSSVGQPVQTGPIFDGDGRVVLAASDTTQYAFEGETLVGQGARSVFTHYLVEGLTDLRADANQDGVVTVDELYEYLYPRVTAHTPAQMPIKWTYRQRGMFILAGQGMPTIRSFTPTWRTWIVDQMHRGDFTTIGEAIAAVKAGDKLVIRPGVYDEGLVIDKPLEIEGEGDLGGVVIQATGKPAILFKAITGQVRHLTLRQNGGGKWYCVDIVQGRLLLEGCDISSQSLASVAIYDKANPIVRNNRIHDGHSAGIVVYEQGQGIIEENDIFANANAGIRIRKGGNPTVRKNRVHDGKAAGIFIYDRGQGLIEKNDIFANINPGIQISEGSNPTVRNNCVRDGKAAGIFVYSEGQGVIEENDIFANVATAVEITEGSNPTVSRNRIRDSAGTGVLIHKQGQGIIKENDIFGNSVGIGITDGSNPRVHNNCIHDSEAVGIFVYRGQGVIEENDIFANGIGIGIGQGGNPMVRNNLIHDCDIDGIRLYEQGNGLIEQNDIFANARAGIAIGYGSNPVVRNNRIYDGQADGIFVYEQGQGVIDANEIFSNANVGIREDNSNLTVRNNCINKNGYEAIGVHNQGGGCFENNDLRDNQCGAWNIDEDCLPNLIREGNIES